MTERARGTFDVNLTPRATDDEEAPPLGRMSLDKRFHGELEAASRGEMLTAGSPAGGSAAYVAVERVAGSLRGRAGAFALVHRGIMDRGAQELSITVVPGSGTGELEGLTGTMAIRIEDGKHFYDFEYALDGAS